MPGDNYLDAYRSDLEYGEQEDTVALLECNCGNPGCWPWAVRITVYESEVVWSDFDQVHRAAGPGPTAWDYTGLGPFVFQKDEYMAAVCQLEGDCE